MTLDFPKPEAEDHARTALQMAQVLDDRLRQREEQR